MVGIDEINVRTALTRLRERKPLVHNITNDVVMNVTANALLAAGACPAMVHAPEEVTEFVERASSLVVNIGTLTKRALEAMLAAAAAARRARVPWVLDPVAVGATTFRRDAVARLLEHRPTVIRGNASEILAMVTGDRAGRGVDADAGATDVAASAAALARRSGAIVAATGAVDVVTDGERALSIANGHVLLTQVTGSGCTATALVGAFLGAGCGPLEAGCAALALLGVAAERAAAACEGPGSFQVGVLDWLARLGPEALASDARVGAVDLGARDG